MTAARPLQIIWEQTAQEGGTFSVDFSPDGQKLASGGAYIVQSGAQLYYAENKVWTAHDGTLLAATPRDQITFSPTGQTVATANGAVYCYPNGGCGAVAPGVADYSIPQLNRLDITETFPINATIDYSPDRTPLATGE